MRAEGTPGPVVDLRWSPDVVRRASMTVEHRGVHSRLKTESPNVAFVQSCHASSERRLRRRRMSIVFICKDFPHWHLSAVG